MHRGGRGCAHERHGLCSRVWSDLCYIPLCRSPHRAIPPLAPAPAMSSAPPPPPGPPVSLESITGRIHTVNLYDPDEPAAASAPAASVGTDTDGPSMERIAHQRAQWFIPASLASQRTLNPIRAIVDKVNSERHCAAREQHARSAPLVTHTHTLSLRSSL